MVEREIGVSIAGVLNADRSIPVRMSIRRAGAILGILGCLAATSLAFADVSEATRFGDELVGQQPLPAQAKYLEERAARIHATVNGDSFPQSDELIGQQPLPAQARYLEEHAASIHATVNGDSFPQSDELIGQQPLPSQAQYFAEKARRTTYARGASSNRAN